jgi:hypothetical protein
MNVSDAMWVVWRMQKIDIVLGAVVGIPPNSKKKRH